MKQLGIKGRVTNLQTVIKKNDDGDLEATFRLTTPDVDPLQLQQLFRAQRAGNLEFSITSQQLELFSSKEDAAAELPVN